MGVTRTIGLVHVELEGIAQAIEAFHGQAEQATHGLEAAAKAEAEAVMADSKANYCPVDLGTLRDSGFVDDPEWHGDDLVVTMGYGGAAEAYALAVHEHLSDHSPYSWRIAESTGRGVHFTVGGPKYLELPMLAAEQGFEDRVFARLHLGEESSAA